MAILNPKFRELNQTQRLADNLRHSHFLSPILSLIPQNVVIGDPGQDTGLPLTLGEKLEAALVNLPNPAFQAGYLTTLFEKTVKEKRTLKLKNQTRDLIEVVNSKAIIQRANGMLATSLGAGTLLLTGFCYPLSLHPTGESSTDAILTVVRLGSVFMMLLGAKLQHDANVVNRVVNQYSPNYLNPEN